MAYSRWTESRWHTFWCGSAGWKKNKEIFSVCGVAEFEYAVVKKNTAACAESCRSKENEAVHFDGPATDQEIKELEGYMRTWLKEVDAHYAIKEKGRKKKGKSRCRLTNYN